MRTTLLIAVASLLLSLWSLVARVDAAPPLPVCGAGQWVLPAPTIGTGIAGSAVQTVVLGADGTLALTGACPPIAAKVKGIRTGTSVKASWPAGFCGGVGGKGKLAATIDAACLTMQGKFSAAKLKRIFEAPRSPCDVGLLDTGGTPRCVAPAIATGNAATHGTLDDAGCLVGDVTVTTASGVSAHLASGSCLVAGKKPLKGGDVEIALDDAGGPPSAAGLVGIVRLRVRPKGKGAPLVVEAEPPATLTLPLADAFAGTWFTNAFLDAGGFTATLHDATPVLLDAVPVANGAGQAGIAIAGPVGLSFESRTTTSTVRARRRTRAAGSSTVTFVIPPDPNLPDPRVVHWKVINPKTAQIVVVGLPVNELGVGDSDTSIRQGHVFDLTVLESSGQRRVELTSDVANRFVIELGLHDGTNGNGNTVLGDAVGGCADETCLADAYIGFVKVTARAKNFAEVVTVRDTITGRLPAGAHIAIRAVHPVGRRTQGVMTIFGLDASAQTLVGVLPTSWAVAASDRTLDIDTHPGNVLGEWQGTMDITGPGGSPLGCSASDPLCARLSVQSVPGGLRIAYCNSIQTQCGGSAASQPCALLFDGHATATGLTGIGFDNNAPCCIGCLGQNRVYGCQLDATVTVNGKQQTLEGTFAGSVTFCPSDASGSVLTHFKVCRPKPCAVP